MGSSENSTENFISPSQNQGLRQGSAHGPQKSGRLFFPVQPENFRALPVEKLQFFPVQPENMRAVTPVLSSHS